MGGGMGLGRTGRKERGRGGDESRTDGRGGGMDRGGEGGWIADGRGGTGLGSLSLRCFFSCKCDMSCQGSLHGAKFLSLPIRIEKLVVDN